MCRCCGRAVESLEHMFDECETLAHIRFAELRPEVWFALPRCLRLHGLMPTFLGTPDERLQMACTVQQTLLAMWQHRCSFRGAGRRHPGGALGEEQLAD